MPTTTRDRTDEIRALEELWDAPTVPERPERKPSSRLTLPLLPGGVLAVGWVAFFLGVLAFEPAPEPGMTTPAWGVAVLVSWISLLFAAAAFGPVVARLGFAAAVGAGALGMVVAISCRATEHHLGNWWLAELGATAALTGLAALGLGQRLRR
jgi:hypothetical protein